MFVRNDVLVDARVLKEAGSLSAAGHDVTIVGIVRPGMPRLVEREQRDGFIHGLGRVIVKWRGFHCWIAA